MTVSKKLQLAKKLMQMLVLNKAMDLLAIASSIYVACGEGWHSYFEGIGV